MGGGEGGGKDTGGRRGEGGGVGVGGEGVGIFLLCYNEIYLTSPPFPLGSLVFNDPFITVNFL